MALQIMTRHRRYLCRPCCSRHRCVRQRLRPIRGVRARPRNIVPIQDAHVDAQRSKIVDWGNKRYPHRCHWRIPVFKRRPSSAIIYEHSQSGPSRKLSQDGSPSSWELCRSCTFCGIVEPTAQRNVTVPARPSWPQPIPHAHDSRQPHRYRRNPGAAAPTLGDDHQ